jgi:hypothetical protein
LLGSGHLPRNSSEYLEKLSINVNVDKIIKIHSIHPHLTNSPGEKDYIVVNIKINCPQLRQFYGNSKYLVQVWCEKKRLYQHIHDYPIQAINMNDTQFAYTLQMDNQQKTQEEVNLLELEGAEEEKNEDYDKNLDFIFIVRPFKQDFCRVEYPFTNDKFTNILEDSQNSNKSQRVLFINENILIAAQNNQIKIANTSVFFEDEKDSTTVSA